MKKSVADVNVLFALLVAGHVHHQKAWQWWQSRDDESVALCLLTRLAILRLLTNQKAMADHPVTPEKALTAWEALAADPRCVWTEPIVGHDTFFQSFVKARQHSPNLWADAWLAAHAESHNFRLTSFDSDFRSCGLTEFEHLVH